MRVTALRVLFTEYHEGTLTFSELRSKAAEWLELPVGSGPTVRLGANVPAPEQPKGMRMDDDGVLEGLTNLGISPRCGACLGIFFTGSTGAEHNEHCTISIVHRHPEGTAPPIMIAAPTVINNGVIGNLPPKEFLVEAIESAIRKSIVSFDLADWIDREVLAIFTQHASSNAVQALLLYRHEQDK